MLSSCLERVQALGADPIERTIYRLFWPFDYQRLPNFKGTLADLLQSDSLESDPGFRILQLRFVIVWIKYLVQPSAQRVQERWTLSIFSAKRTRSMSFWKNSSSKRASARIRQTYPNHAPAMVLDRWSWYFAARRYNVGCGRYCCGTALVETLSNAGFDDEMIDKILADLVGCGDQEATRLQASSSTIRAGR